MKYMFRFKLTLQYNGVCKALKTKEGNNDGG